jgi:alkylation response protein AidB-like acyl-CoA dehydrogenase
LAIDDSTSQDTEYPELIDTLEQLTEVLTQLPPSTDSVDHEAAQRGRAYLAALAPGGWMVPTWPTEYGGRTSTPEQAQVIRSLLRQYSSPDLYLFFVGLNMVGPALLAHGSAEQRARWMPPIATGEDVWCQMFSEPEAGSDLANVATQARPMQDSWRLQGQKVWTSRAHRAGWGLCLARTDPDQPKHRGMTMFAVRMTTPGVIVRPLVQMNGDQHFSEVFLDDVEVGATDMIGQPGDGWKIAQTVLTHERSSIASSGGRARTGTGSALPRWLQALGDHGNLDDPAKVDAAIAAFIDAEVGRLTAARAAAYAQSGRRVGPESSGQKLRVVASLKRRAYLAQVLLGADGLLAEGPTQDEVLAAPSLSIRGGTDEIQRNIIAERVLGLPAEPRADRDLPWSVSRRGGLA